MSGMKNLCLVWDTIGIFGMLVKLQLNKVYQRQGHKGPVSHFHPNIHRVPPPSPAPGEFSPEYSIKSFGIVIYTCTK